MSDPRPSLNPETVDELLSAELDGEFDAVARDLDLDPVDARSRLAAMPGVDERRRALARARDLLATTPALDPAVEDRLVSRALAGHDLTRDGLATDDLANARDRRNPSTRRSRVFVAVGAVAAAVVVIFGVIALLGNGSSKSERASAPLVPGAAEAPPSTHGAPGSVVDFGNITQPASLRTSARTTLFAPAGSAEGAGDAGDVPAATNTPATAAPADETVKPGTPGPDESQPPAAAEGGLAQKSAGFGNNAAKNPADHCVSAVRTRYRIAASPSVVGVGTVSGAPVDVVIFNTGATPVAYVVSEANCSLVRKQALG